MDCSLYVRVRILYSDLRFWNRKEAGRVHKIRYEDAHNPEWNDLSEGWLFYFD